MGASMEDGLECPRHHTSTQNPARVDVSDCHGVAVCGTCMRPCIWRAKSQDSDITDKDSSVKAKSTPAYQAFAFKCVYMTQWTGGQDRDKCGGFGGFFEDIAWITRKYRAAKTEFEEGSVGHASKSLEHLFSSPYHMSGQC